MRAPSRDAPGDTARLFVAVELPGEVRRALGELAGALDRASIQGLRPVAPEGIHLTLKFLGAVPRRDVERIGRALSCVARLASPHRLELGGVGGFPDLRRPRVLWVGLAGETERLQRLRGSVERALVGLGYPPEERGFSPHLTLARLGERATPAARQRAGEAMASTRWRQGTPVAVEAISLMESILGPGGAAYRCLLREPLGGGGPGPEEAAGVEGGGPGAQGGPPPER